MRAYLYVAKMRLLSSLAYRFDVFTSLGTGIIIAVASIFLWKAAYSGTDSVSGVDESQMIAYVMVSALLTAFFSISVAQTLPEKISQGDIVIDFYRPINLVIKYFAEDLGLAAGALITRVIPMLIFLMVCFGVSAPKTSFLLFMLSTALSFVIIWTISAIIAMLSFWFFQLGSLSDVKDGIVLLLSGQYIPLWLFPKEIQNVLSFLPFQHIYQTPLSIYIGRLKPEECLFALLIELVWAVFLILDLFLIWSKARRKVLIQGG